MATSRPSFDASHHVSRHASLLKLAAREDRLLFLNTTHRPRLPSACLPCATHSLRHPRTLKPTLTKEMAPKPASTAGKAPASTASKAPAKTTTEKAAKKTAKSAAAGGDEKKKRRKVRKETYSSYIYKGGSFNQFCVGVERVLRFYGVCVCV